MNQQLVEAGRAGDLVVMAGAGVSSGRPSALPGWMATNAAIMRALVTRLETAIQHLSWLQELPPVVDAERNSGRFPPDYQAQIIEEMCGERYFHALQALDIDAYNSGHDAIAALVAAGKVRAVVTTNFDRLIEKALDARAVRYVVAKDEATYDEMSARLGAESRGPIPILKIHGCVSDPLSMIDTLKQRKRGRSKKLLQCLDAVRTPYWIFLGFSADDLEADPGYLGLVAGAAQSRGAMYIAYPGRAELRAGAQRLIGAYGERGAVEVAHVAAFLHDLCAALEVPQPNSIADDVAVGSVQFQKGLEAWANSLTPAASGLCIAAILEAIGQAEPAVRILDRLVRKELYEDRDSPDFRALQLHYGRLGAAWGRFIAVPDINGAASNASVESVQSLLRIARSEYAFAARTWLACMYLWLNEGKQAFLTARDLLMGFYSNEWDGPKPRSDEEAVDGWISAAQVCCIDSGEATISAVYGTSQAALERAKRSGDVVRTARVAALTALVLAETDLDVPELLAAHEQVFREAQRVGDRAALAMRELAHGRWLVGRGGLALAQRTDPPTVANQAVSHLNDSIMFIRAQGMDPWEVYSFIQLSKAYSDLRRFDEAQECAEGAKKGLKRFPVLETHLFEAVAQVRRMFGETQEAAKLFRFALEAAEASGLAMRVTVLKSYSGIDQSQMGNVGPKATPANSSQGT